MQQLVVVGGGDVQYTYTLLPPVSRDGPIELDLGVPTHGPLPWASLGSCRKGLMVGHKNWVPLSASLTPRCTGKPKYSDFRSLGSTPDKIRVLSGVS